MSGRRRPARFRLVGRFDGSPSCTITITSELFTVRPLARRRVYEFPLEAVARGVIFDVVQAETRAKFRERLERAKARKAARR